MANGFHPLRCRIAGSWVAESHPQSYIIVDNTTITVVKLGIGTRGLGLLLS